MMRLSLLFGLTALLLFATSQSGGDQAPRQLLQEAQMLFDSARYDEALSRGQAALARFHPGEPASGECLLLLGNAFLETGQWETALEQYKAALAVFRVNPGPDGLLTAQAYNNLGDYFYKKGDYPQAESYFEKALRIRENKLRATHELVADSYNNLGNCRVGLGDYTGAKTLHEKALAIRQKVLPPGHPDLATSYNNLGNCAYLSGEYGDALQQFRQALAIRQQTFGSGHPKTAQVYNNLGNVYAALGERTTAVRFFKQALDIRRQLFGDHHPTVASALENLADLCFDNGDHIVALDFYRQAHRTQQQLNGDSSAAAASLWHKIGLCYQYEGDYAQALKYHLAAEPNLRASFGPQHPFLAGLYNNLGNCFAGKKDYPRAACYYEHALAIFQGNRENQQNGIALVLNNLGTVFLQQHREQRALDCFDQALDALYNNQLDALPEYSVYLKNKGLALERLGRWPEALAAFDQALATPGASDPLTAMDLRSAQGILLCQHGMHTADPFLLQQAIKTLDTALSLSDSLRAQLGNPASRQRWIDTQFPALAGAMEACYAAWKLNGDTALLEQAFALAERNKSLQLLEHLRQEQAGRFAGIPDSLLEQERQLGETLNRQEKERLAWLSKRDTAHALALETGIAGTRQALSTLIQHIEKQYPAYYRLRYAQQSAGSLQVRRQMLGADEALVEYTVLDSALFVFVCTRNAFQCLRLVVPFSLDEQVAAFRHCLQAYPQASGAQASVLAKRYVDLACQLYAALLAPVKSVVHLPKKLLLVPDGALAYLPFECLIRSKPDDFQQFKNHTYLIREHRVSYAYSATQQLALMQTTGKQAPENLLAIAPVYPPNRFGLRPLQNNRVEARAVRELFGGDLLEDTAASVNAFLAKAARYRVLLCATHGQASSAVGDLSYLAFSPPADSTRTPFLFARDLYYQSIPADLVVLSACETSVGEYRIGQGVISLARAFFQAGARSVVATLWSVDDARNAELIRAFFQGIKAGLPKDEALQEAKLSFLRTHPHDEAFPVYWAGITAYGDMEALELGGIGWWWVIGGAVGLTGLYFILKRARKVD